MCHRCSFPYFDQNDIQIACCTLLIRPLKIIVSVIHLRDWGVPSVKWEFTVIYCHLLLLLFSNRVFTEGTCKLLNLVISDLVDEDYVIHHRRQSISALIFGTSALLSKPGQTLAPLFGTWLLAKQTGYSIFYSDTVQKTENSDFLLSDKNFHDTSGENNVKLGCFYVLVYIPIACALLQIVLWRRFKLHGSRLKVVTSQRISAEVGNNI